MLRIKERCFEVHFLRACYSNMGKCLCVYRIFCAIFCLVKDFMMHINVHTSSVNRILRRLCLTWLKGGSSYIYRHWVVPSSRKSHPRVLGDICQWFSHGSMGHQHLPDHHTGLHHCRTGVCWLLWRSASKHIPSVCGEINQWLYDIVTLSFCYLFDTSPTQLKCILS